MWPKAVAQGAVAGLAGALVMTAAEKIEQPGTHRPDSHVPARTLERLLHLPEAPRRQSPALNVAMHLGQGALLGRVARGDGDRGAARAVGVGDVLDGAADQ